MLGLSHLKKPLKLMFSRSRKCRHIRSYQMGEIYLNFSQIVLLITNVVIKTRQVNKKHVTQLSLPKKFVDHRSQFVL